MKTIQAIIQAHGGLDAVREDYISIENEPYMRLVIEEIEPGPRGYRAVSVAHYGEQNGDAMRDPEMTFEIGPDGKWTPLTYRNDYVGVCQEGSSGSMWRDGEQVMYRPSLMRELKAFARQWDRNIEQQGFLTAYRRQRAESLTTA